jgi:hypothetical protein
MYTLCLWLRDHSGSLRLPLATAVHRLVAYVCAQASCIGLAPYHGARQQVVRWLAAIKKVQGFCLLHSVAGVVLCVPSEFGAATYISVARLSSFGLSCGPLLVWFQGHCHQSNTRLQHISGSFQPACLHDLAACCYAGPCMVWFLSCSGHIGR